MKLLFVIHQYFPDCFSGTEQYCLMVSREARRRGDEVVVLSLQPHYDRDDPPVALWDEPYDGFSVLRLRLWAPLQPNDVLRDHENPLAAARFRDVLDDVKPDAVHFFHLRNLGADLLDVARERGIRTVVNLMDFWYLCPRFTLLRSDGTVCDGPPDGGLGCVSCAHPELEGTWSDADVGPAVRSFAAATATAPAEATTMARTWALLRRKETLLGKLARVDAAVAPSEFLAGMFRANGYAENNLHVVPYGLEPGRVEKAEVARPRSPLRVAFAGVLSPWKAPHVAVDAVRKVPGDLTLTVHGRTEEHMFRDYIADLIARAEGDERITFPGAFDAGERSRVLAETDVLVVPSTWYENTPFVILEALEAGVPVVASKLGGMTEIIRDGVNGWLFEAGDADALADVLRACLADPDRIASLRPGAGADIARNYDRFAPLWRG